MLRPKLIQGALVGALAAASPAAQAAWVVDPSLIVSTRYSDNITLAPDNEDDGIGTNATAQARVRRLTETSSVAATMGVTYEAYSKTDQLDNDHREFINFSANRFGERLQLGLGGTLRHDSILRTGEYIGSPFPTAAGDAASADPDAPIDPAESTLDDLANTLDPDAGSVEQQIDRYRYRIKPSLNYALSERTDAFVDLQYYRVDFDKDDSSQVEESDEYGATFGVSRRVSTRTQLILGAGATRFEPEESPDSDVYEAFLGVQYQLSESTRMSVNLGANRIEDDFRTDTGFLYNVMVMRRMESGSLRFNARQSFTPDSFGDVTEYSNVGLTYARQLSPRFSVSMSVQGTRRDSGDNLQSKGNDRDYVMFRPGLNWRLSESISLQAAYDYRWTDRENQAGTASSNSFSIGLRYDPPSEL